jgi:PAS domain S-box-containing protein
MYMEACRVGSIARRNRLEEGESPMGRAPDNRSSAYQSRRTAGKAASTVTDTEHLAVLEALHLPVSLINPRYTYRWVNSCYAAAHGKKPEEIIDRTVRTLWGKVFDKEIKDKLDECFAGREARDESWVRFPALGRRYCEVVYSPYCPDGKSVSSAIVITYDITERKELEERLKEREQLAIEQVFMQRDLSLRLAKIENLDLAITLILETALNVAAMESGGIWLKSESSGDLELISSINQSEKFSPNSDRLPGASAVSSLVMQGHSVYGALAWPEGSYGAIVPILREGQAIGALSLSSNDRKEVPEQGRLTLDFLSAELGTIIARMQARQQLEKEMETRKEAEKALEAEHLNLHEANAALRVLLKHREEDRKELEERLVVNVKQLVLPHVEKLKKSRLDPPCATTVDFIQSNLKEILTPFLDNLRCFGLTPRQLEIIALIKAGRTTKDIAEALHVTKEAIDKQRFLIRKKLDINKEKTNMRSYLLSLA